MKIKGEQSAASSRQHIEDMVRRQRIAREREYFNRFRDELLSNEAKMAVCEVLDDEAAARSIGEAVTDYALADEILSAALKAIDPDPLDTAEGQSRR